MEILGSIIGFAIYFYGGAFIRWIFVYNFMKSFKEIHEKEKEKNRMISRIILIIEIIIIYFLINI